MKDWPGSNECPGEGTERPARRSPHGPGFGRVVKPLCEEESGLQRTERGTCPDTADSPLPGPQATAPSSGQQSVFASLTHDPQFTVVVK